MAKHRFPLRVRAMRESLRSSRRLAIAGAVVLAMGGAGAGMALAADGGTAYKVSLYESSDGNAACSNGDIVLTTGAAVSTTFAEADPRGVEGKLLSATAEPSFGTDNYAAGSPRWVVELANGNSLWGYPPNSGINGGKDFSWAVNNGNSYLSYAAAYAAADAGSTTVRKAGIVMDGDQPSTTDTITGATFNGLPMTCSRG